MNRRALAVVLGALLAVVLLAALLRHADLAALRAAAAALPLWAWLAAALGLLASYALRALRLQAEWGPRVGARFGDCLHLMLLHNAAVNLLPMRAGEAGYPWLLRRRFGVAIVDSSASLLRLRLQDLLLLGALALALFVPNGVPLAIAAVAAAITVWVAGARVLADAAVPQATDGRVAGLLRTALRALLAPAASAAAARWGWACAAANWSVKIVALGGLLATLAGVSLVSGLRGALGGELAAVLPLQGPAGLGTYEGGVWAAVALHDRSALTQLGIAALAVHLFVLVVSLAAAAVAHAASSDKGALRTQEGSS
jgi:uncharacterized membrane protein YbhN (UPF0104 family)